VSRLTGYITLVTGGASGIGASISTRFAAEGAHVVIADVNGSAATATVQRLVDSGHAASAFETDVSRGQDVTHLFRSLKETHGRLDVIVSNAGLNVRADFRHLSDAEWVRIREVNLDGVVRIARDGFDLLRASGRGSLINIASIMGHRGLRQLAGYSATKGAVAALTRALAVEYAAFGIRVNTISPGFVETALTERILKNPLFEKALLDQTPLKRFGTGEDIASAALFLASGEASFVTGSELVVDGGMSAML
jgi:NAD(P)-dependent dehydrogenase (short-subunit alcohol dehydrogenase family)